MACCAEHKKMETGKNSNTLPSASKPAAEGTKQPPVDGDSSQKDVQAARKGLLRAIWQTSVAPRFSSKPIDMEDDSFLFSDQTAGSFVYSSARSGDGTGREDGGGEDSNSAGGRGGTSPLVPGERFKNSLRESSKLTRSERDYLEELLKSDDLESIQRASRRLADKEIFPPVTADEEEYEEEHEEGGDSAAALASATDTAAVDDGNGDTNYNSNDTSRDDSATSTSRRKKIIPRRNSLVQQQLFEWHEKTTIMPSAVLRRMSSAGKQKQNQLTHQQRESPVASSALAASINPNNSITQDDESSFDPAAIAGAGGTDTSVLEEEKSAKGYPEQEERHRKQREHGSADEDDDASSDGKKQWNPLTDLNSWIDGSEGVEVDDEGTPEISSPTSNPFKILGTSADDISCHPHVLSPPLMEGLQLFMPESLQEHHYWLKYSLVRDGPGLMKMLRQCRGSQHAVLAIETTEGHVFGSFTSQPWRLIQRGYYGSKESFVWRMRRSRNEPSKSVMEQILMESKIDVFPFTSRNNKVQLCTMDILALGQGEVEEEGKTTEDDNNSDGATTHHGHAIKLDKSMASGSTSSSETFGNPCLIQRDSRGETFTVANIELWSLTPHETVEEADQAEMRVLFLEESRNTDHNLNLIDILVGTHVK